MTLEAFFAQHPRAALGFSGGVDSAYLLYAARQYGCQVGAYFIQTPFQPQFELEDAQRLAASLGVALQVLPFHVLDIEEVAANGPRRCYYCKRALFSLLARQARKDGYPVLLDGTNASDDAADRPGMQALEELSVLSPLRLCGLTKDEIRRRSREAGLFTWDKPAYACLATRIPTGTAISAEDLRRVERGESALFSLGFSDFRLRLFHGAARIQLTERDFARMPQARAQVEAALRCDFSEVLLDLKIRPSKGDYHG